MATVTTLLQNAQTQKGAIAGAPVTIPINVAVASGAASSGDTISLFTIPNGYFVTGFHFGHDATMGAGATATAKIGSTSVSAATTAGAAGYMTPTVPDDPALATADRVFGVAIGTANIAAGFNFKGHLKLAYAR